VESFLGIRRGPGLLSAHADPGTSSPSSGVSARSSTPARIPSPAARPSLIKHPTREAAEQAKTRLVAQVEAERVPHRSATAAHLLDRWMGGRRPQAMRNLEALAPRLGTRRAVVHTALECTLPGRPLVAQRKAASPSG
jgi:hypothetical protein